MIKLITWNVNSVNVRLPHMEQLLASESPDILLLQEIKCEDHNFPTEFFENAGYNVVVSGQKSYNGVAICSKFVIDEVKLNFPGNPLESQKRFLEISLQLPGLGYSRIISLYAPNGAGVDHERFGEKIAFYRAFNAYLKDILRWDEFTIVGGDYNIAPGAEDVYDYKSLKGTLCCSDDEIALFQMIENYGYSDIFRSMHPDKIEFTWWDYRGNGFAHNKGYRIDHFLGSPRVIEQCQNCYVNSNIRAMERPSDHAPLVMVLGK